MATKPTICYLAPANSIHTVRWVSALAQRGYEIIVLTLHQGSIPGVRVIQLRPPRLPGKLGYFWTLPGIRAHLSQMGPAILHAHSAASYGLLGALSNRHPFIVSVWGGDILTFPGRSPLKRSLIRFGLSRADVILATSQALANSTHYYTQKPVQVTSFGVETSTFRPDPRRPSSTQVTIGIVKSLEPTKGIDTLIRAFAIVIRRFPETRLLIVGDGTQGTKLRELADSLSLSDKVTFVSAVPHEQVPQWLNRIDIFATPSYSESFGVVTLEASACGLPVVAAQVDGVPEVVVDGKTGFLVSPRDPQQLADKLEVLIDSPDLRIRMGRAGRDFVVEKYAWEKSVDTMVRIYDAALA